MIFIRSVVVLLAVLFAAIEASRGEDKEQVAPVPLRQAHAHNDYLHSRPLLDALEHGFCSVEADIWLVDGELLVAHDRRDVKKERTLQTLYLDPLRARMKGNGGRVFRDGPPFHLLIDIKSDGESTYRAPGYRFVQYSDIIPPNLNFLAAEFPLYVTISGYRPISLIASNKNRLIGVDGRLSDLKTKNLEGPISMISDNWRNHFRWDGKGDFPIEERRKLRSVVEEAHERSLRVRFWNTPETPAAWKELFEADVDVINTDDLAGLQKFLVERQKSR